MAFSFDRLIVRKAIFEEVPRTPAAEGEQQPATLVSTLHLTLNIEATDEPRGVITLGVIVAPDLKWQPYRLEVAVAGVFGSDRKDAALFEEFCKRAVPSILFPYARQVIHNLTIDAAFGAVRINPVNIQTLMATNWQPTNKGTTGG